MNCMKAQDLFSSCMEHTIDPSLCMEFEEHLAVCPKCSRAYEKFNATIVMVEELPEVKVPEGFHAAVMARVEQARQAAPHKVKWWNLDWGTVFTVKVPARAVAMGFAALLLMALVVQLTPLHTVTAGLAPLFQSDEEITQSIDEDAIQPWGPWGQPVYQPDSGLSISVAVDSSNQKVYAIRFDTADTKGVEFDVYLMPNGGTQDAYNVPTTTGKVYYSSIAARGKESVVRVDVGSNTESKRLTVAKVAWNHGGRSYSEYVFMPSHFDPKVTGKGRDISFKSISTYDLLSEISARYGVVVLASGDLGKTFDSFVVKDGTPSDVLYKTGFEWKMLASSVYMLQLQQ